MECLTEVYGESIVTSNNGKKRKKKILLNHPDGK